MADDKDLTRREFITQSGMVGGSLLLATPMSAFAAQQGNIQSRGYAAIDTSGKLVPWRFERRPVGDNDILIDIKYASICHSDIHQMKGHWGPQKYPQVPGHEIVGIVTAVGRKVIRFKAGDRAGVGCMVDSCLECPDCKGQEEQYCPETVFT